MPLMNYTTDDAKDTSTNEVDEVSTKVLYLKIKGNFC